MKLGRGLSLLEVVIVTVLIAVLMAMSLPMLSSANANARSVVCKQNLADIGVAIATYTTDHRRLPTLFELPPQEAGMSLPELVADRLKTPSTLYCPSDETQRSQLLGTSYRWANSLNGLPTEALVMAVDQPVLADREPFHTGADTLRNELVLERGPKRFQFSVIGNGKEQARRNNASQNDEGSSPSDEDRVDDDDDDDDEDEGDDD